MSFAKGMAEAVASKANEGTGLHSQGNGWIEIQEGTFTNLVNVQLEKGGPATSENIVEDLKSGVVLLQTLEVVSGKPFKRYNKTPKLKVHKLENLSTAFDFMKQEGLTLVNIGSSDIEAGNQKLVLGLLWTLIYHYQIAPAFKNAPAGHGKKSGFKDLLLQWVREQIPEYDIKNFNKDWLDGKAMCALVNAIGGEPWLIPNHQEMLAGSAKRNATTAVDTAYEHLGIPKVLEAEDLVNPDLDELSVMTYISYFRTCTRKQAGGATQVEATSEPEPEPEPEPVVEETKTSSGLPPPWERDGDWRQYEGANLGGRCKIRVYSSTTTSSQVTRSNTERMMSLFERMNVHERPDFEPWCMVDLMDKPERDAVFAKAGTRTLPMLFVDDEFVGSYDEVMDLNESNQLAKILDY
jgi:filamin